MYAHQWNTPKCIRMGDEQLTNWGAHPNSIGRVQLYDRNWWLNSQMTHLSNKTWVCRNNGYLAISIPKGLNIVVPQIQWNCKLQLWWGKMMLKRGIWRYLIFTLRPANKKIDMSNVWYCDVAATTIEKQHMFAQKTGFLQQINTQHNYHHLCSWNPLAIVREAKTSPRSVGSRSACLFFDRKNLRAIVLPWFPKSQKQHVFWKKHVFWNIRESLG